MIKIEVKSLLINYMKVSGNSGIFLSELTGLVKYVSRKVECIITPSDDIYDTIDASVPIILENKSVFRLLSNTNKLYINYVEKVEEYVEKWPLPDGIYEIVVDYWKEYTQNPMMLTALELDRNEECEKYICKDSSYFNWLLKIFKDQVIISTQDIKNLKTAKDVQNMLCIQSLYIMLSRYYKDNMMQMYKSGGYCGYLFVLREYNKEYVIGVFKKQRVTELCTYDYYEVQLLTFAKITKEIPYFPDIAMRVKSKDYMEKVKLLEQFKSLFKKANSCMLDYDLIRDRLDSAYGLNDDDDR